MKNYYHLTFFYFYFFLGTHIFAADTLTYQLPRITVTANRYEKDVFESHLQVNILKESQIWQQGISRLGDWIESVPGISQTQAGPWSQKPVIRGLTGAHVLTLVDGMRLDVLRAYGDHAPLVDVNQIERIEIIRGPGSVLYGSNAVAGVMNIITKTPNLFSSSYSLRSRIGFQYESVNHQKSEMVNIEGNLKRSDLMINLAHRQADDISTPSGILNNSAFSGYTADMKMGFHLTKFQTLRFAGHLTRMNDVGVPINPFAQTAHFTEYNRNRLSLDYKWMRKNVIWNQLNLNFYYQTGEREFDAYLYHVPKGALFVNNRVNAQREVKTYGGSMQSGWSILQNNLFIAGLDFFTENDDTRRISDAEVVTNDDQIKMDPPADLSPPTPIANRKGGALFIEDEWHIFSEISVNTGLRYDFIQSQADGTAETLAEYDISKSDHDFSGSFGSVIRLSSDFRLTLNIGRAFKAPTLQERFFRGNGQALYLIGNPDLKSETSVNLDMGVRWQKSKIQTSLNLFQNRIDNYIVMKPITINQDTFLYDNVGEALLIGAEWEGEWHFTPYSKLYANAAYVRGKDVEMDEDLPKIPPLNGTLGIEFSNSKRDYWISVSEQICSKQNKTAENELTTDGYQLLHLSSGINLSPWIHMKTPVYLTLNIKNLLNEKYRDHLSSVTWWDAPGRNFIFGIRGNF